MTRGAVVGLLAIALLLYWDRNPITINPRARRSRHHGRRPRRGSRWTVRRPRPPISGGAPGDMPKRTGLSPEYLAYTGGTMPGLDGVYWPDRVGGWLDRHQWKGGRCEIARWLPDGGCHGWAEAVCGDHKHYRTLFREGRDDVALGCRSCHVAREWLKDQGVNIYQRQPAITGTSTIVRWLGR